MHGRCKGEKIWECVLYARTVENKLAEIARKRKRLPPVWHCQAGGTAVRAKHTGTPRGNGAIPVS